MLSNDYPSPLPAGDPLDGRAYDETAPLRPDHRRRYKRIAAALLLLVAILFAYLLVTAPLSKSLQPIAAPSITLLSAEGKPIARRGAVTGAAVDVSELRDRVDSIRDSELERALQRLSHLQAEDRAAIERLASQIAAKILHAPMVRLREAARADNDEGIELLDAARYLFQLNQPDREPDEGWSDETGVA